MRVELDAARTLTSADGAEALTLAALQQDPDGLSAASALRARFDADLAAAALTQERLRRKAFVKFGERARDLFLTPTGLEQASRPDVARWRAERMAAAGVRTVVDLGCGIGADSLAFADAGLRVVAVELDPVTAHLAQANLGARGEVICADAESVAEDLLQDPTTAVFCDPARRDGRGRLWNVEQFTPSWSLVLSLLQGNRPACIKLGPALPHSLIPDAVEAEWVSHNGDVVEVALWAGPGARADARVATLLPGGDQLVRTDDPPMLEISDPLDYLYEPNGAVIRAGAVTIIGEQLQACLLDDQIAYLTSEQQLSTPFATTFKVLDNLPYKEKVLKAWLRDNDIGTLEIKKRGIDVDPAVLRKRLRPSGKQSATLILTRTRAGARALVAERCQLGVANA